MTKEVRTGAGANTHTHVYDLAGNRTKLDTLASTFDDANKLLTIVGGSVSHDADGNVTSLSGTGVPGATYVWDDRNKLVSQTSGGVTTSYGYSASGRRIWSQTGSNPRTFYIFDGGALLGELKATTTVTPIVAYTWGENGLVSERLPDVSGSLTTGTSLWYAYGPQGETRQLTNTSGAIVDSYSYTAYGVSVSEMNNFRNPFRYGGMVGYYSDLSVASGNILCTQRWYNPATTRWLSRDPIGYEGGANLYEYALSSPVMRCDPVGSDPPVQLLLKQAEHASYVYESVTAPLHGLDLKAATVAVASAPVVATHSTALVATTVASGGVVSGSIIAAPIAIVGAGLYAMGASLNSNYGQEQAALERLSESEAKLRKLRHQHHIFPREFIEYFKAQKINIDDYAITIDAYTHLRMVHGNGLGDSSCGSFDGNWNKRWKEFINANRKADVNQIMAFAGALMDQFGLKGKIHKYYGVK